MEAASDSTSQSPKRLAGASITASTPPTDTFMTVDSEQQLELKLCSVSPKHLSPSQMSARVKSDEHGDFLQHFSHVQGIQDKQESKCVTANFSSSVVASASPYTTPPFGADRARKQAVNINMQHTTSPRHLYFSSDSCDSHARDAVAGVPHSWLGNSDIGAHYMASHQLRHHGDKLRSDAYLRQALTSPYNQRSKQISLSPSRPSHRSDNHTAVSEFSPSRHHQAENLSRGSPHCEKKEGGMVGGSPRYYVGHVEGTLDPHTLFKTPRRMSPRRDKVHPHAHSANGCLSPVSTASGGSSSSGGHHPHHNPFENGHDRLHFPMFSPGIFHGSGTPASTNGSFRWDPEHLAELRPVHIDDKDIKRQLSRKSPDTEVEERAQRAIEYYFAHHMVAPSPWGQDPPPHVLPVTPAYDKGYMSTPNEERGSILKELSRNKKGRDASCQTTLTLPVNIDLYKVLGEYMTYQDPEEGNAENMSNSSLRRKLFFNADCSSVYSPVKTGKASPDHMAEALLSPPPFTPNRKTTPEWERGSPTHTPSSVQFSSSPIRGPFCSDGEYLRCSFSDHGALASPELSPIGQKQKDKPHVIRRFSSMDSNDAEQHIDDVDVAFGLGVRKRLQMDVPDGSSPPPGRPSPNMSPITFSGNEMSQTSRSRTLRADPSPTSSVRNESSERERTAGSSQLPLHFTSYNEGTPATTTGFTSMDTDPFTASNSHDPMHHNTSPREVSMTDVGEGGSGLDTLQHPSSLSNQDTGYQTASGSGSLQTTHDGALQLTQNDGVLQHISGDAGMPSASLDSSSYSASTEGKLPVRKQDGIPTSTVNAEHHYTDLNDGTCAKPALQSSIMPFADLQNGSSSGSREIEPRALFGRDSAEGGRPSLSETCRTQDADDNSSQLPGNGAGHTNLTEQFLTMPYQSEISTEGPGLEFEASTHLSCEEESGVHTAFRFQLQDRFKPLEHAVTATVNSTSGCKHKRVSLSHSSPKAARDQLYRVHNLSGSSETSQHCPVHDNGQTIKNASGGKSSSQLSTSYVFNEKDFQLWTQNEKLFSQDPRLIAKVAEYLERESPESERTKSFFPTANADTLNRHEHDQEMTFDTVKHQKDDSVLERARKYLASVASPEPHSSISVGSYLPPSQMLLRSTPTKRMLGRVAEDLAASRDGSPALASEVAKEILRRAEKDLCLYEKLRPADSSHQ